MNVDRTFWDCVYDVRLQGLIPRTWKTGDLIGLLTAPLGRFSPNTVSIDPYNYSISREGDRIGYFVRRGQEPKAWRVGRGRFQLIVDPDDDTERQASQRELANRRAEELAADLLKVEIQRVLEDRTKDPTLSRDQQGQHKPRTKSGLRALPANQNRVRASGRHESVSVALDNRDRQIMAEFDTERKALYIVEKYIRNEYGEQVEIEDDRNGADLRVSIEGQAVKRIEVKGTASKDLAWSQLKVSSQKSHDALESGEATMFRVVEVDSTRPRIYVLTYGRDFTLEPEPRWAVKQVRAVDDRYPLRWRPYRYDLPYDPVAQEDWETAE